MLSSFCRISIIACKSRTFAGRTIYVSDDLPYPYAFSVKYAWIVWVLSLFLEVIPAYFADLWRYVQGKTTKYVKMQAQVSAIRDALAYFTNRSWVMHTSDLCALAAELSPEDARLFPCNPRDICWKDYSATYFHGVKRFLVDKARK